MTKRLRDLVVVRVLRVSYSSVWITQSAMVTPFVASSAVLPVIMVGDRKESQCPTG